MEHRDPNDLLFGIPAIAGHLGIKRRQAEYQIAQQSIPTFKMGRTVCALRSVIDTTLKAQALAATRKAS